MPTPQERIITAAKEVFGRKGYKAATVREICRLAKVNLAAINYYFGDKTELYRVVVEELISQMVERFPADMGLNNEESPQARLKAFVRALLHRILAPGGLVGFQSQGQLLARELTDPSPALDNVVQDYLSPQVTILTDIIGQLLDPEADQTQIMRCALSVVSQCFHYGLAWPIVTRLLPVDLKDPQTIEALVDHITTFSLGGLERVRTHGTQL